MSAFTLAPCDVTFLTLVTEALASIATMLQRRFIANVLLSAFASQRTHFVVVSIEFYELFQRTLAKLACGPETVH